MRNRLFILLDSEKVGIATLLILLFSSILIASILRRHNSATEPLSEGDSLVVVRLLETENTNFTTPKQEATPTHYEIHPFTFDPNTLDSAGLSRLGLKPFVVRNILKYRAKGGHYRDAEAFGRTYGLDSADFIVLQPFIAIASIKETPASKPQKEEVFLTVSLNEADTALLCQLKGIGTYRAKAIVSYRNRLGGFVSAEQLLEIKNLPEDVVKDIMPHLTIDQSNIRKLRVNYATVERLKSHPYLTYYQAKAIIELRRAQRHINALDALRSLSEFSEKDLQRLAPYLDFD